MQQNLLINQNQKLQSYPICKYQHFFNKKRKYESKEAYLFSAINQFSCFKLAL